MKADRFGSRFEQLAPVLLHFLQEENIGSDKLGSGFQFPLDDLPVTGAVHVQADHPESRSCRLAGLLRGSPAENGRRLALRQRRSGEERTACARQDREQDQCAWNQRKACPFPWRQLRFVREPLHAGDPRLGHSLDLSENRVPRTIRRDPKDCWEASEAYVDLDYWAVDLNYRVLGGIGLVWGLTELTFQRQGEPQHQQEVRLTVIPPSLPLF